MSDINLILPEIFLLSMVCIILLIDLFLKDHQKSVTYFLSQAALIITAGLSLGVIGTKEVIGFSNHFIADHLAQTLKFFILLSVFVTLLYSKRYISERKIALGEYYLLILFSTLGMMLLASAHSILMVFLSLELFALPAYTLIALNRESAFSIEASMKYFITGTLATGMLLYGLSLVYGMTGSLNITDISQQISSTQGLPLGLLVFGLIFMVAGISFKFGAVPFHMWLPDVYEGALSSVTLFIGTAPKIAAFALAYRLLAEAMALLSPEWGQFLIVLSILSLALGNIVAIVQSNIKRMLGYSTIGHVGFILLGFLSGPGAGFEASLFYVVVYALTAAAAFGIIIFLSYQGFEAENISDFKGLAQRNPWVAFLMLLVMFSLTGVPPTVGFYAKFLILKALIDVNLTWLAGLAVIFSVIGAFYYLRIIKVMYFDTVAENPIGKSNFTERLVISLNGLAVLLLGIFPAPLFVICQKAVAGL